MCGNTSTDIVTYWWYLPTVFHHTYKMLLPHIQCFSWMPSIIITYHHIYHRRFIAPSSPYHFHFYISAYHFPTHYSAGRCLPVSHLLKNTSVIITVSQSLQKESYDNIFSLIFSLYYFICFSSLFWLAVIIYIYDYLITFLSSFHFSSLRYLWEVSMTPSRFHICRHHFHFKMTFHFADARLRSLAAYIWHYWYWVHWLPGDCSCWAAIADIYVAPPVSHFQRHLS